MLTVAVYFSVQLTPTSPLTSHTRQVLSYTEYYNLWPFYTYTRRCTSKNVLLLCSFFPSLFFIILLDMFFPLHSLVRWSPLLLLVRHTALLPHYTTRACYCTFTCLSSEHCWYFYWNEHSAKKQEFLYSRVLSWSGKRGKLWSLFSWLVA